MASVFVSLLVAAPALADETTVKDAKSDKNYGYTFEDDPLQSGVAGTTGFVLKVRPKGFRTVLLRPRTTFVSEMLKSVEAL
ncbi:MAG: hypothetical protein IPK82_14555 [Polyangiaceae bacterium]|nr:hypothetical protein [Polyangiaceae bacterium]